MAWVQAHGRVRIDARRPRARGTCDRCGTVYSHSALSWQYQWAGSGLQNLRILVCQPCKDIPNAQLRNTILPPDPVPIRNPRPNLESDPSPYAWPMNTGPIYDTNRNVMRGSDGIVMTSTGGQLVTQQTFIEDPFGDMVIDTLDNEILTAGEG